MVVIRTSVLPPGFALLLSNYLNFDSPDFFCSKNHGNHLICLIIVQIFLLPFRQLPELRGRLLNQHFTHLLFQFFR